MSIGSVVFALEWPDPISSLDNWTVYHGPRDKGVLLDFSKGWNNRPSLDLLPAGSPLAPDPPGFGDQVTSLYWSNPDTSLLSNFTLEFHIFFDDDVGRAFLTFRMQDARNYYAVRLADTHDWTTAFFKFVDDQAGVPLGETANKGIFDSGHWALVRLEVKGDTFRLWKDGELELSVKDGTWLRGRMYGIGIYNGWDKTSVHVDDFDIVTDEPLIFVQVITSFATKLVTSTSRQNTTNTSTILTTTSITRTHVQNSTTTNQVIVPILDWTLFSGYIMLFSLGGFGVGFAFYGISEKKVGVPAAIVIAVVAAIGGILVRDLKNDAIWPLLGFFGGVAVGVVRRRGRESDFHSREAVTKLVLYSIAPRS
jgi:hypothetical protein